MGPQGFEPWIFAV